MGAFKTQTTNLINSSWTAHLEAILERLKDETKIHYTILALKGVDLNGILNEYSFRGKCSCMLCRMGGRCMTSSHKFAWIIGAYQPSYQESRWSSAQSTLKGSKGPSGPIFRQPFNHRIRLRSRAIRPLGGRLLLFVDTSYVDT